MSQSLAREGQNKTADPSAIDEAARYAQSAAWRARAHRAIPGGTHTYAKGDDQYPELSPGFLVRGQGSHVWDADGNEYIEYGAGLRSVTLGHAFPAVIDAVERQLHLGNNFVRPTTLEVECAEELLKLIPSGEMVKFTKNGSDATSAAVRLARAVTGREKVAVCGDQPFFSTDDWFIGTTPMAAGIPESTRQMTVSFNYNDLASVEALFAQHPGEIACLILEPTTYAPPEDDYLPGLRRLCDEHGALLIFDEIISGFRLDLGGAQSLYGVTPDLSTFGKALANGFALAALVGKRQYMERGGLNDPHERVFLLSTTGGAEGPTLAAALATMRFYQKEPVIERLYQQGERLRQGVQSLIAEHHVADYFGIAGHAPNLIFITCDARGERSQAFRAIFMQELIRGGVLAPSFVVNYSHSHDDIDRTIAAVDAALGVYTKALTEGVEQYLVGPPVKPVLRTYN